MLDADNTGEKPVIATGQVYEQEQSDLISQTKQPKTSKRKVEHKPRKQITQEERIIKTVSRLRNEPRIKALTEKIQDLLLTYTKDLFVKKQIERAKKNDPRIDIGKVEHEALKICKKWTAKNVRVTLPSHITMARILTNHAVCSWKEGDTAATWHIAFHQAGYKAEFPLDRDDLPVEPPGTTRTSIITRVRKKADHKIRQGRLGIVTDRDREASRNSRSEWRIFLLRYDKGDGKLDQYGNSPGYERQQENMLKRHKGEKHQKALLRQAMTVPIKKSANMVDAVLDAWTKEEE